MNKHIILVVMTTLYFAVNETVITTAQEEQKNLSNSTNSDKQKIVVTWLETNDTKTSDNPAISISDEDFWKTFEPLLKQSINGPGAHLNKAHRSTPNDCEAISKYLDTTPSI